MPLFGTTDILKGIRQALMGNQSSTLDAMLDKLFPPENSATTGPKGAPVAGNPKYAPLGVLSFEAAAAMNRGVELWESLQPIRINHLRQITEIEGVQKLISNDSDLVWRMTGVERLKDLKVLISSVCLLGQKSSDPRLQRLHQKFAQTSLPATDTSGDLPAREIDALLGYMKDMVITTQNLHSELEILQAMEPRANSPPRGKVARELALMSNSSFNSVYINPRNGKPYTVADKLQIQTKTVQKLKATCLWVENADRAVMMLVLFVYVIRRRFGQIFGRPEVSAEDLNCTLGTTGLALHYAHILTSISKMVERPTLVLRSQREELYQKLPSNLRQLLKQRLKGQQKPFDIELAADLRQSLESMLRWVMPIVQATLMWQRDHSYGQQFNRRSQILQVQTLFYAKKEAVEIAILELLVGLSYIVRPVGVSSMAPEDKDKWREWVATGGQREPQMGLVQRRSITPIVDELPLTETAVLEQSIDIMAPM